MAVFWLPQLRRRSQRGRAARPRSRMNRLVDRFRPQPRILHTPIRKTAFSPHLRQEPHEGMRICAGGRPVPCAASMSNTHDIG